MGLPSWLEPLPDAAAQRATDAWAIETLRIPGETLMERAGAGLAEQCSRLVPEGLVAVVCGKGNNGGDGFVAARLLREQGRAVSVLVLAAPEDYQGDAKLNLERLRTDVQPFTAEVLDGAVLIVDAILGTGFSGEPHGPAAEAIAAINAARSAEGSHPQVIACDVPSGVDASTGEIATVAVQADLTVTFHAAKPGLWIHPGKSHARRVRVVDIGIPSESGAAATRDSQGADTSVRDPDHPAGSAEAPPQPQIGRIAPAVRDLVPRRDLRSNKFTAGSVLVCGGSRGLTGAPVMAAMAAARSGAGYVTAAVPESVSATVEAKLLEIMTFALPDDPDNGLKRGTSRILVERASRAQALVLGPGLGRQNATASFAKAVAQYANLPLVIDADALNALASLVGVNIPKPRQGGRAQAPEWQPLEGADGEGPDPLAVLKQRTAPTVLTPHAGELARLLRVSTAEIDARRLHHARLAAERSGAVVVLKGDDTLVATPAGTVAVSPGAAPALATAGTGDVLSGITGAFLAKGVEPFVAACAAVDTHLRAGRLAAKQVGPEGVIASDVINLIPKVLAQGPRGGEGHRVGQ